MYNAKVFLLVFFFFLLAIDAFAARINHSAKYKDGDKIARITKSANVPDDKEELIIENIKKGSAINMKPRKVDSISFR